MSERPSGRYDLGKPARHTRSRSLLRSGAVGILLVALATGALTAAAWLIALLVSALG